MSIGPARPAASTPKARASTTRTPPSGSMPRRAHARSANDTPGDDLDVDVRGAQQQDRAFGDIRTARHRIDDLAMRVRGVHDVRTRSRCTPRRSRRPRRTDDRAVRTRFPRVARSSIAGWRAVRTNRTGTRSNAARAAGRTRSAPAGPSPTTTTRADVTRRALRRPWSSWSTVRAASRGSGASGGTTTY